MNWLVSINDKKIKVTLPKKILTGGTQRASINGREVLFRFDQVSSTLCIENEGGGFENYQVRSKSIQQFPGEAETSISAEYVRAAEALTTSATLSLDAPGSENRKSASGGAQSKLRSPMTGKVLKTFFKEGEKVEEGQTLMVIEAMKMENQITSPASSIIKKLNVSEGDNVSTGNLLIEFAEKES